MLLAIDPKTSSLAISLWSNGRLVRVVKAPVDSKMFEDLLRKGFWKYGKPTLVICEAPFVKLNIKTYGALMKVIGVIEYLCKRYGIPFKLIQPSAWQNKLLRPKGKKKFKREEIKSYSKLIATTVAKYIVKDDNEADAINIGYYYLKYKA